MVNTIQTYLSYFYLKSIDICFFFILYHLTKFQRKIFIIMDERAEEIDIVYIVINSVNCFGKLDSAKNMSVR